MLAPVFEFVEPYDSLWRPNKDATVGRHHDITCRCEGSARCIDCRSRKNRNRSGWLNLNSCLRVPERKSENIPEATGEKIWIKIFYVCYRANGIEPSKLKITDYIYISGD